MFDLKRFRKDKRLTQTVICEITGYSQGSISNIERGSFDISPEALDILVEKFGDDVRDYINDEPLQNFNNISNLQQETINSLQETIKSQQRTIENLSETIKNLTTK
ncbi:MAG: helix-turn-helix transcriptional regulator [Odoribacter sp.]